jgi:hypothetical protein
MAYDMKPTMDQMLTNTAAITPHVAVNRSLSDYCRARARALTCGFVVARGGVEPPTFRFSVGRSYQLSYLALHETACGRQELATPTGLEPATSAVTGRRANQLRYGALGKAFVHIPYGTDFVSPTGFEPVLPP